MRKNSIEPVTKLEIATREMPLEKSQSAILYIDVQNYCANPKSSVFKQLTDSEFEAKYGYFFKRLKEVALPNMRKLQVACRKSGIEVLYTKIESLTKDCRDFSLDYKISGFFVPKNSWEGKIMDQIAPNDDEMVFPKSSSSVFVSTNLDYVLRNMEIRQLVICGLLTDQCVESAVRDACDLGYLVTLVPDACATYSQTRHENSLQAIKGYCRQVDADSLIPELS